MDENSVRLKRVCKFFYESATYFTRKMQETYDQFFTFYIVQERYATILTKNQIYLYHPVLELVHFQDIFLVIFVFKFQ